MNKETIIIYDEAAKEVVVTVTPKSGGETKTLAKWLGKDGRLYDDERGAKYASCTHIKCRICSKLTPRHYLICDECKGKEQREKFNSFPKVEWDRETPITLYDGDEYFFDEDDLYNFCEERECRPSDLMLVLCEPTPITRISTEIFDEFSCTEDETPIPRELEDAVDAFNEAIGQYVASHEPPLWSPSKIAVIVPDEGFDFTPKDECEEGEK